MKKKTKILKVYGMSGHNYKPTPTILMKGQWLKDLGFEIGSKYHAELKNGKIIITLIKEELD